MKGRLGAPAAITAAAHKARAIGSTRCSVEVNPTLKSARRHMKNGIRPESSKRSRGGLSRLGTRSCGDLDLESSLEAAGALCYS